MHYFYTILKSWSLPSTFSDLHDMTNEKKQPLRGTDQQSLPQTQNSPGFKNSPKTKGITQLLFTPLVSPKERVHNPLSPFTAVDPLVSFPRPQRETKDFSKTGTRLPVWVPPFPKIKSPGPHHLFNCVNKVWTRHPKPGDIKALLLREYINI